MRDQRADVISETITNTERRNSYNVRLSHSPLAIVSRSLSLSFLLGRSDGRCLLTEALNGQQHTVSMSVPGVCLSAMRAAMEALLS